MIHRFRKATLSALASGAALTCTGCKMPRADAPVLDSLHAGTEVSAEGLQYTLVATQLEHSRPMAVGTGARSCGRLMAGWLTVRGNWWVAVDSVLSCIPNSSDAKPTAQVDSGIIAARGDDPSRDTLLFTRYQSLLPYTPTLGIRRGDTLVVRADLSRIARYYLKKP